MKTEISRQFTWGFVLSEQELRRVLQTCQEHAAKLPTSSRTSISTKLRDGAVIESTNLDDILTIENVGSKAIEQLSIKVAQDSDP